MIADDCSRAAKYRGVLADVGQEHEVEHDKQSDGYQVCIADDCSRAAKCRGVLADVGQEDKVEHDKHSDGYRVCEKESA